MTKPADQNILTVNQLQKFFAQPAHDGAGDCGQAAPH